MTNMYNAEYGHTGGGVMNVVLKSGTNQHHITAWEFMRRTPLDANTFQNNAIAAHQSQGGAPRPTHYLDQYGWLLEGPIRIPKILRKDGPVKLFYMGAYEGYREGTPNPLFVSYPEPEMRTGRLLQIDEFRRAAGSPFTTPSIPLSMPPVTPRKPFPGNIIPKNLINPIAKAVTQYMPLPNRRRPPGSAYAIEQPLHPELLRQGQVLQSDPEVRREHRQQEPRLFPPRSPTTAPKIARSTVSTTSRAPTGSSPSSASTTRTWRTGRLPSRRPSSSTSAPPTIASSRRASAAPTTAST